MLLLQADPTFAEKYVYSYTFLYGFIGSILLIIALWIRARMKKHPDLKAGEVVHLIFLSDIVTIFMTILFVINLSEAAFAASVKTVMSSNGIVQQEIPQLIRALGHVCLQSLSIITGTFTPLLFLRAIKIKENWWMGVMGGFFFLAVTLWLPYKNLSLISDALDQRDLLDLWIRSWNPWADMEGILYEAGYPEGFDPYREMQFSLKVSSTLMTIHFIVLFLEAWLMMYIPPSDISKSIFERLGVKSGSTPSTKEDGDFKTDDAVKDAFKYLLSNALGKKHPKLTEIIEQSHKIHANMVDRPRANLSNKVSDLMGKIKTFNKDERSKLSAEKITEKLKSFNTEIRALWKHSPEDGKGFGIDLPEAK